MTIPYPYQEEGVRKIEEFGIRALLADEQGLGKTLQSLLVLQRNREECLPTVISCPAHLKWNWEREIKVHIGMRAEVLEGTKPPSGGFHRQRDILILNHEILRFWTDHLIALKPKLVILDECQAFSNRTRKRTKAAKTLCMGAPHVLALSGTPITNRTAEMWPILNMIRPDLYPAFWPYGMEFCRPKRTFWGWDFKGASNLDKLHRQLDKHLMIRRLKKEVLPQLPAKRRSIVPIPLADWEEYEEARDDYLGWIRKHESARLGAAERAEQLGRIGNIRQVIGRLKLPAVYSWTKDFLDEGDSKLVLFAYHRKVISELEERFANQCVRVDGSVTGRKRQQAVDKFIRDKRTRLFVGQIRAAGTGWNAKGVSDFAFCELDWTPGWHLQAEDRGHGLFRGKEGIKTHSRYLTAGGTFETGMVKALIRKQKTLNSVLDDGRGEKFDLITQATEAMKKETEG